mmetsp:Transcript_3462/g.10065  ORF Transcript_3462/g.10065 Transcript_3462/m.10065 type:complete len:329 (-) Transcript_3462:574-1560(-)
MQTTSLFVPAWLLAAWRLGIGLFFCAELLLERFTARNGLGKPGYVWVSFFTDWTFVVFGFSGFFGFAVTVWRMTCRARSAKTHSATQARQLTQSVNGDQLPTSTVPHSVVSQPSEQQPAEAQIEMHQQPRQQVHASDTLAATAHPAMANGISMAELERKGRRVAPPLSSRQWTCMEAVYLLLAATSATSSLLVPVIYWAALSDGSSTNISNLMKHGLNNVMVLGEVLLSRIPFVSYHFQVSLIYGTLYLIFMWAIWLPVENYWVYDVFDWSSWRSLGYYALLPIALCIAFLVWTGVAALREVAGAQMQRHRSSSARPSASSPVALNTV